MNTKEYEKKKIELLDKINELSSQLHKLYDEHDTTMLDDAKAMFEGKWVQVFEMGEHGKLNESEYTLYYIDKLFHAKKEGEEFTNLQASCIEVNVDDDQESCILKLVYDSNLTDDRDHYCPIYLGPWSAISVKENVKRWRILDDEEARAILAVNVSKMENLFKRSGRK